jgi:hypothetical protein
MKSSLTPPIHLNGLTSDSRATAAPHVQPIALDEHDMAAAMCISPTHLANLRKAGQFPFVQLGQRILYPIHVVKQHLTAITQGVGRDPLEGPRPSCGKGPADPADVLRPNPEQSWPA